MKVKIVKCNEGWWYRGNIGKVVEVKEDQKYYEYYNTFNGERILKSDTVPVNEINKTVQCSWQDKMDLKSIAVRFENVEQREAIFKKFKEKRFDVSSIPSEFVKGDIGYSYCFDYVCVLSEIGLKGKKIISYEEFMGGKEMKRLEVLLKIQPDGKTVVGECIYISEELRGKGVLTEKDGYSIKSTNYPCMYFSSLYVMGDKIKYDYINEYEIFDTPEQAQRYVKVMNELIDEINNPRTNWNKVEEGAEVVFKSNSVAFEDMFYKTNCNFHSYIPNLKKVVLIVDEEVKVVDEDKVELIKNV